jgi:hypothetical protein
VWSLPFSGVLSETNILVSFAEYPSQFSSRAVPALERPQLGEVHRTATNKMSADASSAKRPRQMVHRERRSQMKDKASHPSGWNCFCTGHRDSVAQAHPGASGTDVNKLLSPMWQALSADEKSVYARKAALAIPSLVPSRDPGLIGIEAMFTPEVLSKTTGNARDLNWATRMNGSARKVYTSKFLCLIDDLASLGYDTHEAHSGPDGPERPDRAGCNVE